jgi:predicted lysophospholipase L1 biosynthesis ABC-type transport system permease subunit
VRIRTVEEDRNNLTETLDRLGNYLGLVALMALLLGGLGVASAVSVFIRRKLDSIAVLRCLGASSGQVFSVYLLQAAGMGLLGSIAGVLGGIVIQQGLPLLLRDFLPVTVSSAPSLRAIGLGLLVGLWVSTIFALLPLLSVRRVPPLAALRPRCRSRAGAAGSAHDSDARAARPQHRGPHAAAGRQLAHRALVLARDRWRGDGALADEPRSHACGAALEPGPMALRVAPGAG